MAYINRISLAGNVGFCAKYHTWRYQSTKRPRKKNYKPTTEQQQIINDRNAAERDMKYAIHNFKKGDRFIRLSYQSDNYPADFEEADKNVMKFLKRVKRKYPELRYMANTEEGSRGGLHHHLIIPEDFDVNVIIDIWYEMFKGGFHIKDIYSNDIAQLAKYFTKGSLDKQVSGGNEKNCEDLQHEHKKVVRMKIHKSRNLEKPPEPIKTKCKADSWREEPQTQVIGDYVYDVLPGSWITDFTAEGYPYAGYILIRRCKTAAALRRTKRRYLENVKTIRSSGAKHPN
ncbi:MAG: hypothetical protein Q4G33_05915 [bacterium]|nr:hypothetical protein [bacterium]